MKLSTKAIAEFKGPAGNRLKSRIALEMNKSIYSVDRWLNENESNGPLTTAKVLQIIQEETELVQEILLEESEVTS